MVMTNGISIQRHKLMRACGAWEDDMKPSCRRQCTYTRHLLAWLTDMEVIEAFADSLRIRVAEIEGGVAGRRKSAWERNMLR